MGTLQKLVKYDFEFITFEHCYSHINFYYKYKVIFKKQKTSEELVLILR